MTSGNIRPRNFHLGTRFFTVNLTVPVAGIPKPVTLKVLNMPPENWIGWETVKPGVVKFMFLENETIVRDFNTNTTVEGTYMDHLYRFVCKTD